MSDPTARIFDLAQRVYQAGLQLRRVEWEALRDRANTSTGHFSICILNDIRDNVLNTCDNTKMPLELQAAYDAMAAYHCIPWSAMSQDTKAQLLALGEIFVQRLLNEAAKTQANKY